MTGVPDTMSTLPISSMFPVTLSSRTTDSPSRLGRVGARVALQGNLDPQVLLADAETVRREAVAVVRAAGSAPGHVFNLGHGIVPATPPENVAALVDAVHAESLAARASA